MLRDISALKVGGACLAIWLLFSAAGCASLKGGQLSADSRLQLEQRVRERRLALEARDYDKMWEFTTPNYRSNFPKRLYAYNFSYAVHWELTAIEVVNYDAEAAVASVAVRVMSEPTKQTSVASRAVGKVPVTIHEQWLNIDREWWYSSSR